MTDKNSSHTNSSDLSSTTLEIENDAILPWEEKGFSLKSFLLTVHLLIFHPSDAFTRKLGKGSSKAFYFFLISLIISRFFAASYSFMIFNKLQDVNTEVQHYTTLFQLFVYTISRFASVLVPEILSNSFIYSAIIYPLQTLFVYFSLRILSVKTSLSWLYKSALYLEVCSFIYLLPAPHQILDYAHAGLVYSLFTVAIVRHHSTSWIKAIGIVCSWLVVLFAVGSSL